MIKKGFVICITVLALAGFGTAPAAQAFVEPVSLTLILGTAFVGIVSGSEAVKHAKEEQVKADQKTEKPQEVQAVTSITPGS